MTILRMKVHPVIFKEYNELWWKTCFNEHNYGFAVQLKATRFHQDYFSHKVCIIWKYCDKTVTHSFIHPYLCPISHVEKAENSYMEREPFGECRWRGYFYRRAFLPNSWTELYLNPYDWILQIINLTFLNLKLDGD